MARYRDAKCRLCRREGMKLFLKGARCFTDKCAIERRNYPPGMHGLQRGKLTPYGVQLREKQKAKRIYGVLESQFRKYFQWAESQKGVTGENLLRLLELRLDNVVFRLGFAASRRESRQMVAHGHFQVNGRKVNVPSFLAKVGDVVQLRPTSKMGPRLDDNANAGRGPAAAVARARHQRQARCHPEPAAPRGHPDPRVRTAHRRAVQQVRRPGAHATDSVPEAEEGRVGDPERPVRPAGGRALREGLRPDGRQLAASHAAVDRARAPRWPGCGSRASSPATRAFRA